MTQSVKARVSLNLPASLKAAAERYAERDGVSLNQFISVALAEKIGAQDAAAFFERRMIGGDPARAIVFLQSAPDAPPTDGDEIAS
ncbi:MAG: pilus assembly protein HicB [Geminicoccaceae bacterium]|nr:pilus assembly protein HicB [Geminicoccaceae bacterium]